ncbi:MAG: NRDE family protein [Desulfobacterales bacterium]|jgi:uncharacterized protein with NRDE domain|nr:NRDE family protein [Desulfobacterales bacterium]
MCLILFAYRIHPEFKLILAANRDEFYDRPALPLGVWQDRPHILAGRDLRGGGTWLGVTRTGRFAAITNYRDPASVKPNAPSRGLLLTDYLISDSPPETYLNNISQNAQQYNGFNLLIGNATELYYYSNREGAVKCLEPGLYGLSNHLLNTAWPKVARGKNSLKKLLQNKNGVGPEQVFQLLFDKSTPPAEQLPDTGVGLRKEKMLSPMFISSKGYGTRSSSVLLMSHSGQISFAERSYTPSTYLPPKSYTRQFHFSVDFIFSHQASRSLMVFS